MINYIHYLSECSLDNHMDTCKYEVFYPQSLSINIRCLFLRITYKLLRWRYLCQNKLSHQIHLINCINSVERNKVLHLYYQPINRSSKCTTHSCGHICIQYIHSCSLDPYKSLYSLYSLALNTNFQTNRNPQNKDIVLSCTDNLDINLYQIKQLELTIRILHKTLFQHWIAIFMKYNNLNIFKEDSIQQTKMMHSLMYN